MTITMGVCRGGQNGHLLPPRHWY